MALSTHAEGAAAIETIPDYRRVPDVAEEARSMLWRTKSRAWPVWLGWALLGVVNAYATAAAMRGVDVSPTAAATRLAVAVGVTLLLPLTARLLLATDRPWRADSALVRAMAGLALVFDLPLAILFGLSLAGPLHRLTPLTVVLTMGPALAALPLMLWPFGVALGDRSFTARAALRLFGRTFLTIFGALVLMMLTLAVPVAVAMILLDRLHLVPVLVIAALFMATSTMCWSSVLAAVYGLWRRRRDLEADASVFDPSPSETVAG